MLTEFEQWDTGDFFVNILLFRMYVFNILNQVALALSYILLADPFLLAQYPSLRSSLELPFSSSRYECRIDEAADQLFSLVVSGFVTNNTLLFAIPYAKKCLFYVLNKPLRKVPFDIVGLIVDLNGFVGQILLAIPFVPLVSLLTPIIIYFNVLFQYYAFMWFYRKPERPWKAQKAGAVFTYFYLITVLLLGCSATVYFLTSPTFPKSCDIQVSDSSTYHYIFIFIIIVRTIFHNSVPVAHLIRVMIVLWTSRLIITSRIQMIIRHKYAIMHVVHLLITGIILDPFETMYLSITS